MFIMNQPAMIVEHNSEIYLIIADLHIGTTSELKKKGIVIPSQIRPFVKKIQELKKLIKAKILIINGDLKHKVPGISWQEEKEIPEFLKHLSKLFKKIIIIKGNHDGWIEKLVSKKARKNICVKKFFVVGNNYLTHGNMKVDKHNLKSGKIQTIIIGHNQPHVKFRDKFAKYIEPCWVRGSYNEPADRQAVSKNKIKLIIMPAFNPLCGASLVNVQPLIGPIAKNIDKKTAHIFLLDGTDLGTISDLKSK